MTTKAQIGRLLTRTRELLASGWIQGSFGVDADGTSVGVMGANAVQDDWSRNRTVWFP